MREYIRSDDLEKGFRKAAEASVDLIRGMPDRVPVCPGPPDEEFLRLFREGIREEGIGLEAAVEEFRDRIAPRCMATPHPLYLGLVNSSPLPGGMVGDLFTSVFNNNGGNAEQGPASAAAEQAVIGYLGDALGIPGASGLILPGGSFANLTAMNLARDRAFPEWAEKGPAGLPGKPVYYTSEQGHFSLRRCARILGTGDASERVIPCIGRGEMDVPALEEAIRSDRREGKVPFCIAATAGTTATGAYDDLEAIGEISRREGIWFHVDGAYGGAVCFSEKHRHLLGGIEAADSITIDPHKWLFVPMTAGAIIVRDRAAMTRSFDIAPSYIPVTKNVPDGFRLGPAASRRGSALKIWMAWRAHGTRVVADAIDRNIALTRQLEDLLQADGWDVLPDGEVSIALARDPAIDPDGMARAVIDSGAAWFGTVRHRGEIWLRFNMLNIYAEEGDILRLVEVLREQQRLSPATSGL